MNDAPLVHPLLAGENVQLREWRRSDVVIIQEASHDPLIPLLSTVPDTAGESEALAFIERQHDRLRMRTGYAFAIADQDDLMVGHIGLFLPSGAHARTSVGYWIGPSRRRRGYVADALA